MVIMENEFSRGNVLSITVIREIFQITILKNIVEEISVCVDTSLNVCAHLDICFAEKTKITREKINAFNWLRNNSKMDFSTKM